MARFPDGWVFITKVSGPKVKDGKCYAEVSMDELELVMCKNCWKRGQDNCPMEFYFDNHPADDDCYCAMGERRESE